MNIIHEEIKKIEQNIINEFGKDNITDLQVNLNLDYHGEYFAYWAVLKNNRWVDYRRYYNRDGTIKNI